MFVITVEFTVKAEASAQFEALLINNAEVSLEVEPGCLQFDVCTPEGKTGVYYLYEVYSTEQDFVLHLESEHFKHFNEATKAWVLDKKLARYQRLGH